MRRNENLPYKRKGTRVYNKLYFDPLYVFNEITLLENGKKLNSYDNPEANLQKGTPLKIHTIDEDVYKGYLLKDYNQNEVFAVLQIEEFKEGESYYEKR